MIDRAQFDTSTTHMSFYDNFLNEKDLTYMQKAKNLTGDIIMMTPEEYFEGAVKTFKNKYSVDDLISQRSDNYLTRYVADMKKGDVFPLCFLDFANMSQEGLHRMLAAASAFGWDVEYPVLVVTPYNQELWDEQKRMDEIYEFMRYDLRHIINSAENELGDWDEPVPDNIVDQMKSFIEDEASSQGYDIDVDCEVDAKNERILTYLNRYNDTTLEEPIQSTDYAWLENMFDLHPEEKSMDDELEDLDYDDLEIADFFFK